jgi:hypothetical protein
VGEGRKDEPQTNQAPNIGVPTDQSELLEKLRDRVRFLEGELESRGEKAERLHRIMAGLTQTAAEPTGLRLGRILDLDFPELLF